MSKGPAIIRQAEFVEAGLREKGMTYEANAVRRLILSRTAAAVENRKANQLLRAAVDEIRRLGGDGDRFKQ